MIWGGDVMFTYQSVDLLAAAATDPWAEKLFGLETDQRFALLIIGIGCATGIIISLVAIIAGMASSMHRARVDSELKREMLDRGMSAEEIARVVESSQPKDFLERWAAGQRKPPKT
jgi:hypothetical protein